jgi:hypothetical protein
MEKDRSRFKLYRVKSKIQGVKHDPNGVEEIVTVYPGTTVLVTGEERESGMVDLLAEGEFLSVLKRQLEEHADLAPPCDS